MLINYISKSHIPTAYWLYIQEEANARHIQPEFAKRHVCVVNKWNALFVRQAYESTVICLMSTFKKVGSASYYLMDTYLKLYHQYRIDTAIMRALPTFWSPAYTLPDKVPKDICDQMYPKLAENGFNYTLGFD